MTDQHPITPPPELVGQWLTEAADLQLLTPSNLSYLATKAARWGADQELDACIELVSDILYLPTTAHELRAARRPNPPSLKEQAQAELDRLIALIPTEGAMAMAEPIRRALEALPND
jgi:hypothetical protein